MKLVTYKKDDLLSLFLLENVFLQSNSLKRWQLGGLICKIEENFYQYFKCQDSAWKKDIFSHCLLQNNVYCRNQNQRQTHAVFVMKTHFQELQLIAKLHMFTTLLVKFDI